MAKARYHPLLQDETDTDSDLEIFTAQNNKKDKHRLKKSQIAIIVLATLLIVGVIIGGWFGYKKTHSHKKVSKNGNFKHENLIVNTECGKVRGISVKTQSMKHTAYAFKGIPYAKPPIQELRWHEPVRLSEKNKTFCWKGVYEANQFGSQCPQSRNDTEDCLFLNVFTPTLSKTANLSVFVWIHGGYLMTGNGHTNGYYPDENFVTDMSVVGVSMNYRLNAFGFLTLKELWRNGSYGNYGLLDQILVLKWIQDNIHNFGGNPNLVTVSGQSSGGTSIFGLLQSPLADGLFHRAIPMSGSGKFEKTYKSAATDNRVFIDRSRCSDQQGESLRKCLYNLTVLEVEMAIPEGVYPFWDMDDLIEFPTFNHTDGALVVLDNVIQYKPSDVYKLKRKNIVPVLIGNTAQEVAFGPKHNFTGPNGWSEFYDMLKSRVDPFNTTFISKLWNELYSNETFSKGGQISAQKLYETLTTDARCGCQMNQLSKYYSKSNSLTPYRYVVESAPHEPGINFPMFKSRIKHAFHAYDSFVLFDSKLLRKFGYVQNENDIAFRDTLRDVFKNFMLNGNLDKFNWKVGKTGVFQHGDKLKIQDDYHQRQCEFWNDEKNGFVDYQWIN